jgi:hypothetical protein
MSHTIVYQVEVVKFPNGGEYEDDIFLVLWEAGSNNVYEAGNRRRARDWQALCVGQQYKCIEEICERAGYCEGGGLRLSGSSSTTPEQFIARHRKAFKNAAVGVQGARERGLALKAKLDIKAKGDKRDAWKLTQLKHKNYVPEAESPAEGYLRFRFDLANPDDLRVWAIYAEHVGWSCMEVIGREDWAFNDLELANA